VPGLSSVNVDFSCKTSDRTWEQGVVDGAIAKEQSRDSREAFNEAARDKAAERRGRLEEWAGRIRANRQSNQLEEAGDLARKHHRQMDARRSELAEFYGQREQRKALAAIRERLGQKGLAQLVYRLSGQARADGERAVAIERGLEDADRRQAEARGHLKVMQERERQAMQERHARALKRDRAADRPGGRLPHERSESGREERTQDRGHNHGRERSRGREPPSQLLITLSERTFTEELAENQRKWTQINAMRSGIVEDGEPIPTDLRSLVFIPTCGRQVRQKNSPGKNRTDVIGTSALPY